MLLASTLLLACGAKTGLLIPCRTELVPVPSDVILLLDDSASVQRAVPDASTTRDWDALMQALEQKLPLYESRLAVGASYFPVIGAEDVCSVAGDVGVAPALLQSNAVLRFLGTAPNRGDTPTTAALDVILSYVRAHPVNVPRYVVLVTDGGANCNLTIPCGQCDCGQPGSACCFPGNSSECRDFIGVANRVSLLRSEGVLTAAIAFPVDLSGLNPLPIVNSMDDISLIGGIPNTSGPHRFYPGDGPAELEASFEQLFGAFQSCRFTLPPATRLEVPPVVSVEDGPSPHQDPRHQDGWDWIDVNQREIQLFGAPCDDYRRRRTRVFVTTSLRCELDTHH